MPSGVGVQIPPLAHPEVFHCPIRNGTVERNRHARLRVVPVPDGFAYRVVGDDVFISHHGRPATTLRRAAARRFLAEVEDADPQELMARLTGNYKRGNERIARNHPRNKSR